MNMQIKNNTDLNGHALLPFNTFLRNNGRSASTGQRWRKKEWIATVNIGGRLYVSLEEIARFQARAAAGEFAQPSRAVFVYDGPLAAVLTGRPTEEVSSAELAQAKAEGTQKCQ